VKEDRREEESQKIKEGRKKGLDILLQMYQDYQRRTQTWAIPKSKAEK